MKRTVSLMIVSMAFIAMGCGNQNQPVARGNRTLRAGNPSNPANSIPGSPGATVQATGVAIPTNQGVGGNSWGFIQAVQSYNDQIIKDFLATDLTPDKVGNVTSPGCMTAGGQPCGINYRISQLPTIMSPAVALNGGIAQAIQGSAVSMGAGFITMVIWDSLTGTPNPADGNPWDPITVVVPLIQGGLQGTQIYFGFGDNSGTITMSGNIVGQAMAATGTVQFNNTQVVAPMSQSGTETLGNFQINNLCGQIICQ